MTGSTLTHIADRSFVITDALSRAEFIPSLRILGNLNKLPRPTVNKLFSLPAES
jgi:hypothetical protein